MTDFAALKADAAEIRKLTVNAMASAGYGHIGGSMSICDLLSVLYGGMMRVDAKNPAMPERDRLVLSKGHCGPALYAALAYKGFFPTDDLKTLNANGTSLPSHCDRLKTKGIDISTGSLGQGISLAAGVAYGCKMRGFSSKCYCIVGDGELQEGQNWEAIQFIAHHKLDNLILIVDNNRRQLDGYTEEICKQFSLKDKLSAFGLSTAEADGHDVKAMYDALAAAGCARVPSAVILNTEKGHGCNFSEIPGFNHYMTVSPQMAKSACDDIDGRLSDA